jgi:hypothetical protein
MHTHSLFLIKTILYEKSEPNEAESVHLERNGLENGIFLDSLKERRLFIQAPFLFLHSYRD